jgi:hypothetical protein
MEFSHAILVQIAYKWVLKNGCGVAFREFRSYACNGEFPDVIGFASGGHSTLIECKASRSDFLTDRKKSFRATPELGMGSYRFFCCQKGLIKESELPHGWGLIEINEKGQPRATVHPWRDWQTRDKRNAKNLKAEHELMYSALRRLALRGRIEEVYDGPVLELRIPSNPDPNQSALFIDNQ